MYFTLGRTTRVLCLLPLLVLTSAIAAAQVTGFATVDLISRENRIRADSLAGDSVDAGTGVFLFEWTVMSVQGGRVLTVDLSYNSLLTDEAGALGPGWSHPCEAVQFDKLFRNSNGAWRLTLFDGR